jgi:hypothetical protein
LKKILKPKGSNVCKEIKGNFQIFVRVIALSFYPQNLGERGVQWRKIKRQENM